MIEYVLPLGGPKHNCLSANHCHDFSGASGACAHGRVRTESNGATSSRSRRSFALSRVDTTLAEPNAGGGPELAEEAATTLEAKRAAAVPHQTCSSQHFSGRTTAGSGVERYLVCSGNALIKWICCPRSQFAGLPPSQDAYRGAPLPRLRAHPR